MELNREECYLQVYLQYILSRLRDTGVGCHVGKQFLGALAYADDVVLLAPTETAAQCMLEVAQNFASEHIVTFNESKTKHVIFDVIYGNDGKVNIEFNGSVIDTSDNDLHLGNVVGLESNNKYVQNAIKHIQC